MDQPSDREPTNSYPRRRSTWLRLGLLAAAVLLVLSALAATREAPATAAPALQVPIFTPTPGPDGRIIYIVKANDTLLGISLVMGVPVDRLRELNRLSNDIIVPGQKLLLGLAGPPEVTSTPGPIPTSTPLLPTPTEKPGSGSLCILLFNDRNGDAIRQEEELSISNGEISISNRSGSVSLTSPTTSGFEHYCFPDVPEGDYNVSVAVPVGYNSTTINNYALSLKAGDETYLNFGAQANSEKLAEAPAPAGSGNNPLLGLVGGLFLLAGVGLALFAGRIIKR